MGVGNQMRFPPPKKRWLKAQKVGEVLPGRRRNVEYRPGRDRPKRASFGTWTDVETGSRKKKPKMGLLMAKVLERVGKNSALEKA